MKYDPSKHHRRSIRLKGYDYAQPGAYFVTICTYKMRHLFGEVVDKEMVLNANGRLIRQLWNELTSHFGNVSLGAFVIMPNHLHGIVIITETAVVSKRTLGQMVGTFKYKTTVAFNSLHRWDGVKLWHRNFYEHIIRNEKEWQAIDNYIVVNPQNWRDDPDNVR